MTGQAARLAVCALIGISLAGCSAVNTLYRRSVDRNAYRIIHNAQLRPDVLGREEPFTIESPEDALRRRLLLDQALPYSTSASLGVRSLEPIPHWPEHKDPVSARPDDRPSPNAEDAVLTITLNQALQIAAANSRDYQDSKEAVFRAALGLYLENDAFRNTFRGGYEGTYTQDRSRLGKVVGGTAAAPVMGTVTQGYEHTISGGVSRLLKNGVLLSTSLGWDIVSLIDPSHASSEAVFGDASISIPLLRGAGNHIITEPLAQAERDLIYAMWDFERFKKEFAVNVTDSYLNVLQSRDQVTNQEQNYRGLITSTRRALRLAEAGKLPQLQVDQAITNELRSRNRWITTQASLKRSQDQFKILLGLPTDARIELDRTEMDKLHEYFESRMKSLFVIPEPQTGLSADAPIVLIPPDPAEAGPYELDFEDAIPVAFENRLDLRVRQGRVYDAQRQVIVRADRLKPEVTLLGSASIGEHRSLGSANQPNATDPSINNAVYRGILTLDLPLERTAEAVNYRDSFITLESRARDVQEMEDQIKLQLRNDLRTLLEARESLKIQFQSVQVADRRVKGAALQLDAGRAQMRDLLDAQDAQVSAQNSLSAAMVNYRVAELEMQRDLGVLQVDYEGLWHEFDPKEIVKHDRAQAN